MHYVEDNENTFILGPVGIGKTHLAAALGHVACRKRISVDFGRAAKLHKRLRVARLDASFEPKMRKLIRVDLLIIDDFIFQPLGVTETLDLNELVVERHKVALSVVTSDRDSSE